MFRGPNLRASDFGPIDRRVKLFIYQTAHHHIISSHHEQASSFLFARLVIVRTSDDSLDAAFEREIGDLVARDELADHAAAVDEDETDFFYGETKKKKKKARVS